MILDVVIHDNERFIAADQQLITAFPPLDTKLSLGFGVYLGPIDHRIAKAVMDLSHTICKGIMSPVRPFAHLYAFFQELPDQTSWLGWDNNNELKNSVALSRLIFPCSTGFRYAARVRIDGSGEPIELCKGEVSGIDIEAHVSPDQKRNWLTQAEGEQVAQLVQIARFPKPPTRVSNALWYHEYAYRTWFADVRWTLICTALEALLNTSDSHARWQFVRRSTALARELALPFTEADAHTAYTVRSRLSHGNAFLYDLKQAELRIYEEMEAVLRGCILRALRDTGFAATFDNPAAIEARWPVPPKP